MRVVLSESVIDIAGVAAVFLGFGNGQKGAATSRTDHRILGAARLNDVMIPP